MRTARTGRQPGLTRRRHVPEGPVVQAPVEHDDVGLEEDPTGGVQHVVQAGHPVRCFFGPAVPGVPRRVLLDAVRGSSYPKLSPELFGSHPKLVLS